MNHRPPHVFARRLLARRLVALGAIGALGLSACGGGSEDVPVAEASAAVELPAFGLVSPEQAQALSTVEDVTVIDVRTPEEFADGHIDGAIMIDFYEPDFADDIAALDPDGTYLLYCRSGNRSGQTANFMAQLGFDQVWDMQGGVNAYGADGLPLVR